MWTTFVTCIEPQSVRRMICGFAVTALGIWGIGGCSDVTEVAVYASSDEEVTLRILDPPECDYARFFEVEIIVKNKDGVRCKRRILLKDACVCQYRFDEKEYVLVEGVGWCVFGKSAIKNGAGALVEDDIVAIVDRERGEVITSLSTCHDSLKALILDALRD